MGDFMSSQSDVSSKSDVSSQSDLNSDFTIAELKLITY